jgi:hypothetical protein
VTSTPYPVLQELRLPPVQRRFGTRTRRDLSELPPSPPGTALVFQYDGRFTVYDENRHLTGIEEFVLGALGVAVVNVRAHSFVAELTLHSLRASEDFTVRVTFEAVVTSPEIVVRHGAVDLGEALSQHLRRDPKLAEICAAARIEDIADVRLRLDTRITTYYSMRAFERPGMTVTLGLVEVMTPKELEEYVRRGRATELDYAYRQRVDELEHANKKLLQEQERERHELEAESERVFRDRNAELERDFEERDAGRDRKLQAARAEWEHEQDLLRQERAALLRERERMADEVEVRWTQGFVEGGVPMLLAWAAAKGLASPLELAEMQRGDELRAVEQIKGLITNLTAQGDGDLVSIDVQRLVDSLLEKLTGRPAAVAAGRHESRPALGTNESMTPDETPPDENDYLA